MDSEDKTQLNKGDSKATIKWQNKLAPWLIAMPTLLVIIFIVLATQQVIQFNKLLEVRRGETMVEAINAQTDKTVKDNLEYVKWITLAMMEEESYNKRYNQAGFLIMSRIFTKYLGFFTGMVLAIVGAVFIIGKIKEDTTQLEGSIADQSKLKLVSSSPGIIFGVLGTILMLSTILQHTEVQVRDAPLYLKMPFEQATNKTTHINQLNTDEINEMFTDTLSEEGQ
jgi:hypothetical protein